MEDFINKSLWTNMILLERAWGEIWQWHGEVETVFATPALLDAIVHKSNEPGGHDYA